MAEYGEWNRKGASLSDVTAKKEYGVDREFIIRESRRKLEFAEALWESLFKVLRRQLEECIAKSWERVRTRPRTGPNSEDQKRSLRSM